MYDDSTRRSSKETRDTPDETRLYSRKQAAFASEEDKSDKDCGRVDKGTGVEHCIIWAYNTAFIYLLYNLYKNRRI